MNMTHRIRVWDLPTRLFHWLLAPLVAAAVITGKVGGNAIVWHGRLGLAILGLVAFRIVWGFVGSTHARFASFFPTPGRLLAYFRGRWQGLGHNPLGGVSVFALLAAIALQLGTGLFANDDIAFHGHLFGLVNKELSDTLTSLHRIFINALFLLIGLHLAAIMFYAHVKRDNLIVPMITGYKESDQAAAIDRRGGGPLAFAIALAVSLLVVYGASGAWIAAEAPPPPASAAPAW